MALIHLIWRHAVVNFARIAWFDGFERLGNPFFEILKRDHPILAGGAAGREMTFSDILANHAVVNVSYDVGFKDQLFLNPITIRSKVNPKNARKYDTLDELRREPVYRAVIMQSPELIETERHPKYQSTSVAFHPSEDELALLNNTIAEINARWNNDWLVGLALSTINGYLRYENYHIDTKNVGIFMEDKHVEFGGKNHDRVSVMFLKLGDTGHDMDSLCKLLEGGKDVKMPVIPLDIVLGSCRINGDELRTSHLIFKKHVNKTYSVAETVALVKFFSIYPVSSINLIHSRMLSCFSSRARNVLDLHASVPMSATSSTTLSIMMNILRLSRLGQLRRNRPR